MTLLEIWVREQIAVIEADGRYQRVALLQVNAPLALIQVEMKARMDVLTQVLERLKRAENLARTLELLKP